MSNASVLLPFVSRLSIKHKDAGIRRFEPNWAQEILLGEFEAAWRARRPIRTINLKARQLGISTATEAYIYAITKVLENQSSMVIADESDNAQHLLGMTTLFADTDPFKPLYVPKYQAKNVLAWMEGGDIKTATAGNKRAGRSRTIHMLHASEVAFWENAETVMTGLLQAVPSLPRTLVALESTANGIGNYFYNMWMAAMAGENEYTPLFFPWWMHYEYRASYIRLESYNLAPYTEEELALRKMWKNGLRIGKLHFSIKEADWDDALAWRRWAIKNLCQNDINNFHQEYPATPDEAFIATGTNVFPVTHLAKCYDHHDGFTGRLIIDASNRVVFRQDPTGPLTLFKKPSPDRDAGIYVIGADATHAINDHAVAQVINRRTLEQVGVWRGRIDPVAFAPELQRLGIYFNDALLAVENEGPGFATIGALVTLDYPNLYQMTMPDNLPGRFTGKFGWSSSYKTKEAAIGFLLNLVVEHQTTIHHRTSFTEMRDFVTKPGGRYGPADEEHGFDDSVVAYAIAVVVHALSGPLAPYGASTSRTAPAPVWESWETMESDAPDYAGAY